MANKKFVDQEGMLQILKEVKQYHDDNETVVNAIEIPTIEECADEIFGRTLVIRLAANDEKVDPLVDVVLTVGQALEDLLKVNIDVTYSSDAPTIIEVDGSGTGKMTALLAGNANVTLTPVDSSIPAQTIKVEVQ